MQGCCIRLDQSTTWLTNLDFIEKESFWGVCIFFREQGAQALQQSDMQRGEVLTSYSRDLRPEVLDKWAEPEGTEVIFCWGGMVVMSQCEQVEICGCDESLCQPQWPWTSLNKYKEVGSIISTFSSLPLKHAVS